jgi:hypothetical protein
MERPEHKLKTSIAAANDRVPVMPPIAPCLPCYMPAILCCACRFSQQVGTLSNDLNGSPERVYDPTVNA